MKLSLAKPEPKICQFLAHLGTYLRTRNNSLDQDSVSSTSNTIIWSQLLIFYLILSSLLSGTHFKCLLLPIWKQKYWICNPKSHQRRQSCVWPNKATPFNWSGDQHRCTRYGFPSSSITRHTHKQKRNRLQKRLELENWRFRSASRWYGSKQKKRQQADTAEQRAYRPRWKSEPVQGRTVVPRRDCAPCRPGIRSTGDEEHGIPTKVGQARWRQVKADRWSSATSLRLSPSLSLSLSGGARNCRRLLYCTPCNS